MDKNKVTPQWYVAFRSTYDKHWTLVAYVAREVAEAEAQRLLQSGEVLAGEPVRVMRAATEFVVEAKRIDLEVK